MRETIGQGFKDGSQPGKDGSQPGKDGSQPGKDRAADSGTANVFTCFRESLFGTSCLGHNVPADSKLHVNSVCVSKFEACDTSITSL